MRLNTISDNTEKIILDIFGFPFILIRPLLVTIFRPSHLTRVIFFTDSWALRFARPSTYMFASLFPLTVIALADAHVLAAPANEAGLPLLRSVTLAEGRSFSVWSALPTLALPLGIVLIACHLLSWIISDRPRIRQRARCAMLYAFGTQAFLIGGTLLVFSWLKGLADTALSVEQFMQTWGPWIGWAAVLMWWAAAWCPFVVLVTSIRTSARRARKDPTARILATSVKTAPAAGIYVLCSAAYLASIPIGHELFYRITESGPPCLTATIEHARYVTNAHGADELLVDIDVWNGARDAFKLDRDAVDIIVSGRDDCPVKGDSSIVDIGWSAAGSPTLVVEPQHHETVRLRARASTKFCYLKRSHPNCGRYYAEVAIKGRGEVTKQRLARGRRSKQAYLCNADPDESEPSDEQFDYDD